MTEKLTHFSVMQDMSKWKARDPPKKHAQSNLPINQFRAAPNGFVDSPITGTASPISSFDKKENVNAKDYAASSTQAAGSKASNDQSSMGGPKRVNTFGIDDPMIIEDWDLQKANANCDPIPLDPVALNEARLLCREAMTLITEEAAHLVDHPMLAYAEFDGITGRTKMKRPNYAYPEVLKERLPIYVRNDAADDSYARDAAAIMVQTYSRSNDLFSHIVGDLANPHRKFKPFVSLDINESHGAHDRALCRLSLHAYHHHRLAPGHFSRDADNAIGAIGFRFVGDTAAKEDGCSQHLGRPHFEDSSKYAVLDLTVRSVSAPNIANANATQAVTKTPDVDITRLDIAYVPGSGRIAALTFYDNFGDAATPRLAWKQWGAAGHEPEGLKVVRQEPPMDGGRWRFVGLCGEWDESIWGSVLSRVGGIWRRV